MYDVNIYIYIYSSLSVVYFIIIIIIIIKMTTYNPSEYSNVYIYITPCDRTFHNLNISFVRTTENTNLKTTIIVITLLLFCGHLTYHNHIASCHVAEKGSYRLYLLQVIMFISIFFPLFFSVSFWKPLT